MRAPARAASMGVQLNARLMAAPEPEHVLELHGAHAGCFDAVNLSTAWGRISRVAATWPARRQAAFFDEHRDALERLHASMHARLRDFGARELANTAYACACLPSDPALALMRSVRERAPALSADFKPQELANIAWGFAKAGLRAPPLFEMVERESVRQLRNFKPIELASLAWAFARDGTGKLSSSDALFEGIAREAEARIDEFNVRSLFNLAWAFAATRRADERLFDAIALAALPVCDSLPPQQLAVLAWAMGRVRAQQPRLVRALAAAAAPHASRLQPKHIVMLLWSANRCGAADARVLRALSCEVARTAKTYSALELALVLWASAASHAADAAPLFALVARQLAPDVRACEGRALSLLAYASAVSGHAREAGPLLDAIEAELPARAHALRLPDLVRTGWALAVARRYPPALLDAIVSRVNALPSTALACESVQLRVQLHQINLSLALLVPAHLAGALALSPPHAALCADALRHETAPCAPSAPHLTVSAALAQLRVEHENEYVVPGLGCTVDIAVWPPTRRGAPRRADRGAASAAERAGASMMLVEVNGPHHYLPSGELRPTSALKHAQLRAAGWRVLVVCNDEWLALPAGGPRLGFLRDLLRAGGHAGPRAGAAAVVRRANDGAELAAAVAC
ncbi:hypothetical protein KFE25_007864 [Diacronema lutheri]|uniref:RAP domain-containing protein n=2 Tax=Diacronema lutheri TaxID=2081491 RepID=A0A8J5XI09_DIALT|nr:hypothetical protein KFE25_007864 [Diacronema lutheri]